MSHSEWLSERRTNWPNGRMAERSLAKAYSHKQTELKNAKLPTLVVAFFAIATAHAHSRQKGLLWLLRACAAGYRGVWQWSVRQLYS